MIDLGKQGTIELPGFGQPEPFSAPTTMVDVILNKRPSAHGEAKKLNAIEVDLIRQDRAVFSVIDMFVITPCRDKIETRVVHTKSAELTFRFPQMGVQEMRLLNHLIATTVGNFRGVFDVIPHDSADPSAAAVWGLLKGNNPQQLGSSVGLVRVSKSQLAELIHPRGSSVSGAEISQVTTSLQRLAEVTIHITAGKAKGSTHLIGGLVDDGTAIHIALNPRLIMAGVERSRGKFSIVSLQALRRLTNPISGLLYHTLCGFVTNTHPHRFSEERLEDYIWGEREERPMPGSAKRAEQIRDRRKHLCKALKALEGLDPPWKIEWPERVPRGSRPVYTIWRPSHSREVKSMTAHDEGEIKPPLLPGMD
jgi:hypothetical protein